MALKLPLVLGADGLPQQLQSGDSISSPTANTSVIARTNQEGSAAIVIGAPVYVFAAGQVKLARANSKTTSHVLGLGYDASTAAGASGNIATGGILTATTTQWDAVVTGGSGGLSAGTLYYLDPATAGKLTPTCPTTVGQCVVPVIRALSTTEAEILTPCFPVLL